jgi:hypothetical protein
MSRPSVSAARERYRPKVKIQTDFAIPVHLTRIFHESEKQLKIKKLLSHIQYVAHVRRHQRWAGYDHFWLVQNNPEVKIRGSCVEKHYGSEPNGERRSAGDCTTQPSFYL